MDTGFKSALFYAVRGKMVLLTTVKKGTGMKSSVLSATLETKDNAEKNGKVTHLYY